ncbi:MAG: UvrD-helicase domain-containing protein, partial [Defluviitaleaceae bacterium]|nr:UvrD-helicase domain-containing protein [Defluviitaleaceae bacterium]
STNLDFTKGLNDMQKAAVLHTGGALLLIAGAGSGKTRVLTHRMAHIASNFAAPYNILAITFTNRAAKEMKERVEQLMPHGAHEMWVSTFHACCVRILRRDIHHLGYDNSFTIYDMDDSTRLMKYVIKELNLNEKNFAPKTMLGTIGRLKDEMIGPAEYAASAATLYRDETIAKIYTRYQKHLYSNNALDFDDIILKTLELFNNHPAVLDKYANRFRYIMVDEYQDTNTAQYNLVKMLASGHGNICVVGDDDQSIYGWRGANIRNILDFEKDFKGAVTIKLEQNYRSTANILQAANAVIEGNTERKGKNLWTDAEDGEKLRFYKADSDLSEAAYIIDKINQGVAAGAKHKDFAVLYRTNAQSRVIEDRLVQKNMPYRIFGGLRFYERREVKDALAYMRAVSNPYDDISLKRIINVPKRGIGDAAIEYFEGESIQHDIKFYDALKRAGELTQNKARAKKIEEFVKLLEELQHDAQNMSLGEFVKNLLGKSGYMNSVLLEDSQNGTDRAANLSELVNKAAEFENIHDDDADLSAFLEEVALVADIDNLKETDDAVALMTLHSSKGLEFPTVFLPGLEEGIFPGFIAATGTKKDMEEERRLCYVGITRARQNLFISCATRRMHNGQTKYNPPSRFLEEIPKDLMDKEKDAAEQTASTTKQTNLTHREQLAQKRAEAVSDTAMKANFGKKWDFSKIAKKKT